MLDAVEKQAEGGKIAKELADRPFIEDIEPGRVNAGDTVIAPEQRRVDVRGPDLGALGCQCRRASVADALASGGDERVLPWSLMVCPI